MQDQRQSSSRSRPSAIALLAALAAIGLCSFQYGDNYGLNNMPYAQVQKLVGDVGQAQEMAMKGNIDFFAGKEMPGRPVQLHGELTDANCYLGIHTHGYDHAFCAKFCVATGSPLLFISDNEERVYVVLTARNGEKLPENIFDRVGVPGILVQGRAFEADGVRTLAIQQLQ